MKKLKKIFKTIINDKNFLKGLSTLFGGVILNFLIGAVYSLSTLAIYEISYIKAKGGSIDIYHLTFYWPLEMFFQCISAFLSGSVYKKIGLHLTNVIGVIILELSYILMYFSLSLFQDLTSVILSGIGTGIILYPSTTNAIEWFENRSGLIVGIMESMISFGSFFFCLLGEKVINKNGVESNDIDNLYNYEIGKKFKDFLIILILCVVVGFILSLILMKEKKKIDKKEYYTLHKEVNNNNKSENEKENVEENVKENNNENEINKKDLIIENKETMENKEEKNNKVEELIDNQLIEKINEKVNNNVKDETAVNNLNKIQHVEIPVANNNNNKINNIDNNNNPTKKEIEKELKLKQAIKLAIKSRRLILFVIIVMLQIPVGSMAFALYREIGEYKKIDIKYLQLIGSFTFIQECLSSFVFGLLCDYITIKNLLFIINGVGTVFGFFYCLSFNNSFIFFLVQILLSFSSGGYYPVKDFYLLKVFPKEIYIELNSYVSFLVASAINLCNSLSYFILSLIHNKDTGFWILFISFGILSLCGFILNCFTNEEKINLRERIKKKT
jgi:MFS family permease